MAQSSSNVSNILSLGAAGSTAIPLLVIPEANTQSYFTLYGGGSVNNNTFSPFYKNGVAYQVTSGKTCKVVGVVMAASSTGAFWQLCSATAAITPNTGSLTGPVYQLGATSLVAFMASPASAGLRTSECVTYDFAQNTYPGWQNVLNGNMVFWLALICKEV